MGTAVTTAGSAMVTGAEWLGVLSGLLGLCALGYAIAAKLPQREAEETAAPEVRRGGGECKLTQLEGNSRI